MAEFEVYTTVAKIIRNRTWHPGNTMVTILLALVSFFISVLSGHVPNSIPIDPGMYSLSGWLYRVLDDSSRHPRAAITILAKGGNLIIDQGHHIGFVDPTETSAIMDISPIR
jgi:hypothetical protein